MSDAAKKEPTAPVNKLDLYKKQANHKVTIMRLSKSPNRFNAYCYALIKHELPKEAHITGREGREIFYFSRLLGQLDKPFETEVALIKRTTSNGELSIIVPVRTEGEVAKAEKFAKEVQTDITEARAFGLTKQDVGKAYFAAKYANKLGNQVVTPETEVAGA